MQKIKLNLIPKGIPDTVNVSQYDVGRELQFVLYDGTSLYTIPTGATVVIGGKKGDQNIFTYTATVESDNHTVTVVTTEQMTAWAGENLCQLRITKDSVTLGTVNFRMFVQERPDVGDVESQTDIPAIITLATEQMYTAEAWAKGTKNGVDVTSDDPQYNNHSKYWAEQAEAAAESFAGGVRYKGAVTFANIPTSGMENGWMYNVTDAFTTDARFSEGTGKYCEAGTNIVWDDTNSLWDIAGGLGGVQSFNGRHGNITPTANDYDATQIKFGTDSNVNSELGNKANNTTSFTEASTRANIASGETIPTILGKIKKWFSDLKDLAFVAIDGASSTKYLRGDGTWQALGTAAGYNVPASGNAGANEVVLGNDTRLSGGGGGVGWLHGECATAAATAAKTVTLDDSTHTLADGDVLLIEFTNGNTADTPTLAVNSGTAMGIYFDDALTNYGGLYTSGVGYLLLKYDETNTRFEVVNTSKPYSAHKVDNTFSISATKYDGSYTSNYQKCEYDGNSSEWLNFRQFTRPFMADNWVVSGDRIENTYTYSNVNFFDTSLPIIAYLNPSSTAEQRVAFSRMRNIQVDVSYDYQNGNTIIKLSCDGNVAPTQHIPLIIEGWK